MFGQNPIRSADYADPSKLAIEETFYTIQGEGPFAGRPAIFIRLSGCNLACTFCDTQFEKMAEQSRDVEEYLGWFFKEFNQQQRSLIVITGGEPMRQNLDYLLHGLLGHPEANNTIIQIETAGTLWQPEYAGVDFEIMVSRRDVFLVCSPKTPKVHPKIAEHCSHWKYVIKATEVDEAGLPNRSTQMADGPLRPLYRPALEKIVNCWSSDASIWVSPCDEYDIVKNKANLEAVRDIALKHGYWVSLQTHKILGVA